MLRWTTNHGNPLWFDPPLPLFLIIDSNEHFDRNECSHLRVNASIHSTTPAIFEAKWFDQQDKYCQRNRRYKTDQYFDGCQPSESDSIFGGVVSWVKWSGHQHTACLKYTNREGSSSDTTERKSWSLILHLMIVLSSMPTRELNDRGQRDHTQSHPTIVSSTCHMKHFWLVRMIRAGAAHFKLRANISNLQLGAAMIFELEDLYLVPYDQNFLKNLIPMPSMHSMLSVSFHLGSVHIWTPVLWHWLQ